MFKVRLGRCAVWLVRLARSIVDEVAVEVPLVFLTLAVSIVGHHRTIPTGHLQKQKLLAPWHSCTPRLHDCVVVFGYPFPSCGHLFDEVCCSVLAV